MTDTHFRPLNDYLITEIQFDEVADWLNKHGAKFIHPKGDALKLLEEVLELCFASGALIPELDLVYHQEMMKALRRGEANGEINRDAIFVEVGDVSACLAAYVIKVNVDSVAAMKECLGRMYSRQWAPDESGVLRRPRPAGLPEMSKI
jgi:hypothetical protein